MRMLISWHFRAVAGSRPAGEVSRVANLEDVGSPRRRTGPAASGMKCQSWESSRFRGFRQSASDKLLNDLGFLPVTFSAPGT